MAANEPIKKWDLGITYSLFIKESINGHQTGEKGLKAIKFLRTFFENENKPRERKITLWEKFGALRLAHNIMRFSAIVWFTLLGYSIVLWFIIRCISIPNNLCISIPSVLLANPSDPTNLSNSIF